MACFCIPLGTKILHGRNLNFFLTSLSSRLCAESEQIGATTLETMGRQREQIERSSGFLQDALENTEQARQILKEM